MTIKLKEKDAEGNGYWLYEDGQFVRALKKRPIIGSQFKTVAWLKKGVYSVWHMHWLERDDCWVTSRFPLLKTKTFGIQIVYVEVEQSGQKYKGWVHPRILTGREEYRSAGYETQVKIFPKDLKKTKEEAVQAWKSPR